MRKIFSIILIIFNLLISSKKEENILNKIIKYLYEFLIIFIPIIIGISLIGANDFIIDVFGENFKIYFNSFLIFIGVTLIIFIFYTLRNENNNKIKYIIIIIYLILSAPLLIIFYTEIGIKGQNKYLKCKDINNYGYHNTNLGLEKKLKNIENLLEKLENTKKVFNNIEKNNIFFKNIIKINIILLDLERKTYYELEKNKSLLNYCGNLDIN